MTTAVLDFVVKGHHVFPCYTYNLFILQIISNVITFFPFLICRIWKLFVCAQILSSLFGADVFILGISTCKLPAKLLNVHSMQTRVEVTLSFRLGCTCKNRNSYVRNDDSRGLSQSIHVVVNVGGSSQSVHVCWICRRYKRKEKSAAIRDKLHKLCS